MQKNIKRKGKNSRKKNKKRNYLFQCVAKYAGRGMKGNLNVTYLK